MSVAGNRGICIFSPPLSADSCAQMPTIVQLAVVSRVRERRLLARAGHQEVVREVRVAAAVPAALQEAQVVAS